MAQLRTWVQRAFEPVDGASVAVFRVAFGLILLWEVIRYLGNGWVDRYYIEPAYHFTFYGFSWVQPWPGLGMYAHFVVLGVLAGMIALGLWTRAAAIAFTLGFTYVFLLEQANYLNHLYMVCLVSLLLCFLPLDRMWSVTAWRRPEWRRATVPAWAVWLLRFQLAVVYFYAGVAKLNWDWLRGQPMIDWMAERRDMPVLGPFLEDPTVAWGMALGGLGYDLAVVPLLLWKRTRMLGMALTVSFHLTNSLLFDIGIFPWFMLAATPIFLDPDWPRRVFPVLSRLDLPLPAARAEGQPRKALVLGLSGVFIAYNLLMPLRHYAYPGHVNWTEEGHRFSWHMKLRGKSARAVFTVRDPLSGAEWEEDGRDRLTDRQLRKMSTRPDMVLQYAHELVRIYEAKGYPGVEVRARVRASLNTRPRQLLVDPEVDLAAIERDLGHASWIVPLTTPLPGWDW